MNRREWLFGVGAGSSYRNSGARGTNPGRSRSEERA